MGATAREPSMEDILASIRKIVSQDASAAPAPVTAPRAQPEARPSAISQPPAPSNGAAAPSTLPSRQSFADFARNVTGSEKSETQGAGKADASESPLKPALAGHTEAGNPALKAPSLSGLLKSVRESWPQQAQMREAGARPAPGEAEQSPPSLGREAFGGEMPALERRVGRNPEKPPIERRAHVAPAAAASQPVMRKAATETPAAAEAAKFKEALVSPGTQQAVNVSIDRLKQGVMSGVDAKVESILRPMLKEWLDNHLPGIVEKMVRGEIERIVHEAEQKK